MSYANPLFHFGGKVVVMRGYDPALTLRLLTDPDAGITHFIGAPAHFLFMAQLPEFETARSARLLACIAAAPVPLPQLQQWEARGLPLLQGYGMTETCGVVTMMEPSDRVRKAGSAGKPACMSRFGWCARTAPSASPAKWANSGSRGRASTPGYWKNDAANQPPSPMAGCAPATRR